MLSAHIPKNCDGGQQKKLTDKSNAPVINTEYTRYAPNSVLSAIAPLTIVAAVAANTKLKNQCAYKSAGSPESAKYW